MSISKKFLVLLLALAILCLPVLSACGDDEPTDQSEGSTVSGEVSENPASNDIIPEVIDLRQRQINVYCANWNTASITGFTGEIIYSTEENEATMIDTQKKAVIDWIEENYDCYIDGVRETSGSYVNNVKNMVVTGVYSYDILFHGLNTLAGLAVNDYLEDLNGISTLHLSNSWWDQHSVEDLSIANHLYMVCGDINTFDNIGTWVMLFNKNLKNEYNITEDFYALARNREWTLDRFMEICKGHTFESNEPAGLDEGDNWAFGTELYNLYVTAIAGGIKIAEKDDNDMPYLTVENRKSETFSALQKTVDFYRNSGDVLVANTAEWQAKYGSDCFNQTVFKAFKEGRQLFYECGLLHVASFREMDDEFGILPIPMTFADQDDYHTTVSTGNASFMALPKGITEVEDLGTVIEAIAMKSKELVTPEFYEKQLKYRDTRDDESAEMLDIIFSTRSFDVGAAYSWGLSLYTKLDTDFESRFDAELDSIKMTMEETVETFRLRS
ncbi:MAG: extracellular solute-binding protein [Clostridiales bacterium]|nr:extracellular solute-binding protein [Candidatus Coliplasma caballi]